MTKKAESMTKTENFKIATVTPDEMGRLLSECGVEGISAFDLERVKFPSREETEWSVPDINAKNGYSRTDEIVGVIINYKDTRSYWVSDYDSNPDQPPDCFSEDCKEGKFDPGTQWLDNSTPYAGPPTGDCKTCQYAQYESDPKGSGQACKLMRNLFVITPDKMLPILLSVGPGSYRVCQKFFYQLMSEGITPSSVIVGLSLQTATSKTGISFPKLQMRVIEKLSVDMQEVMNRFRDNITKNLT